MKQSLLFLLAAFGPLFATAFMGNMPARSFASKSQLSVGPLKKLTNKDEYNKVVDGLMSQKGLTREQAEKEYNSYLDNPNDYALAKGEEYYKSLGYNSVMEGVIGEAEKEGRGDEVRERIEEFNKQSKMKGLATISFFIIAFFYYKINYVPPIVPGA